MESVNVKSEKVTGLFETHKDADHIFSTLLEKGYDRDEISVVMAKPENKSEDDLEEHPAETHAAGDAKRGAIVGGAAGAVLTVIAAIGTNLVLPGVGLVLAGPLLAGLTGAAAGGLAGGTIGAIIGSGYPKDDVDYYEDKIKQGGIIISVEVKSHLNKESLADEFRKCNGTRILVSGDNNNNAFL
ncbi:hypothetical protein FEM33_24875 [Dyadobacter flavalbus]|uniref:DUF1269 domain-containing protein n=1 Tax=Dyadobacter flavalbus TaxID=2579942 RepID=A0A5M8Q9B5_9BACT|nr:hypothetical protein [Dyadobacter flavalbus]KAA6431544.1 hypothetical protein FEM33_24875 [Dyadobacter flavalbus]